MVSNNYCALNICYHATTAQFMRTSVRLYSPIVYESLWSELCYILFATLILLHDYHHILCDMLFYTAYGYDNAHYIYVIIEFIATYNQYFYKILSIFYYLIAFIFLTFLFIFHMKLRIRILYIITCRYIVLVYIWRI